MAAVLTIYGFAVILAKIPLCDMRRRDIGPEDHGTDVKNQEKFMAQESKSLKWYEQVVCLLPIALVVIGGAIGGLCGGLAVALNMLIFSKDISVGKKYFYVVLVGLGAVVLYLFLAVIWTLLFPVQA